MKIDLNLIDELIIQYNSKLDDLTIQIDQVKTNLLNLSTQKKELEFKIEDEEKIKQVYDESSKESYQAFSPRSKMNDFEEDDSKKQKLQFLNLELELVETKLNAKESEQEYLMEKANFYVDGLTYLENIKHSIKKQVDSFNNEYYINQLKEIVQKKRLISLEKTKFSSIISKFESQNRDPLKELKDQFVLNASFIQSDPVRAKQEIDKTIKKLDETILKTDKLITKYKHVEPDRGICDSLNSYIGDLTVIYPEIKFRMTVANLQQINNLNMDLNRCLMAFIRSLINSFILKCSPQMIYLRFSYEDGQLYIKGQVIGNYFNFYNEMKSTPTSIVANIYEKIFLLNGTLKFKDNKDGTFNVTATVPVKNYLV